MKAWEWRLAEMKVVLTLFRRRGGGWGVGGKKAPYASFSHRNATVTKLWPQDHIYNII